MKLSLSLLLSFSSSLLLSHNLSDRVNYGKYYGIWVSSMFARISIAICLFRLKMLGALSKKLQ